MIAVVPAEQADAALAAMRAAPRERRHHRSRACHLPRAPVPPCAYAPVGIDPHPRHARGRAAAKDLLTTKTQGY